jgi:hypothetical protein
MNDAMSQQPRLASPIMLTLMAIGGCLLQTGTTRGGDKALSPPAFGDIAKDFSLKSLSGKNVRRAQKALL